MSGLNCGLPSLLQCRQEQLPLIKPLLESCQAALTAEAWHEVYQKAQACLTAIVDLHSMPDLAVHVLLVQAKAASRLQKDNDALEALDLALQLQPDCAAALWQRAELHAAAGRHHCWFTDLRHLGNLQPQWPGILQALQQASRVCNEARRAAVRAAPPPQKTYVCMSRRLPCRLQQQQQQACLAAAAAANAYQVLGLRTGASMQDIKSKYKELALQLHPDKMQAASDAERSSAEERFKAVTAAYQSLI